MFLLKSFASKMTDEDMKDPDVKFFCETNPGWADVSVYICMYVHKER